MEDFGKSPESDYISGELRAFLALSDDEVAGEFFPDVPIKEELVEEVMHQLWKEINGCDRNKSSPPSSPESSPLPFAAAGVNKESCGPSFSDSASTVMAGIKVGGCGGGSSSSVGPTMEVSGRHMGFPATVAGKGKWVVAVEEEEEKRGGGKMDGYDGKEVDDEWLTRVLSWGPEELDEWI
ncbi:hypothetical protein ACSBR1_037755 [Camellia fascicularis]